MNTVVQLIAAGAGTLGFALMLNVRGRSLIYTVLGGFLSWMVYLAAESTGLSEILACVAAGIAVAIYAEICARLFRAPTTVFIITGLIPLIPGSSLYYTMEYAVSGDVKNFFYKGVHTLLLAVAIAAGPLIVNTFMKLFLKKGT